MRHKNGKQIQFYNGPHRAKFGNLYANDNMRSSIISRCDVIHFLLSKIKTFTPNRVLSIIPHNSKV